MVASVLRGQPNTPPKKSHSYLCPRVVRKASREQTLLTVQEKLPLCFQATQHRSLVWAWSPAQDWHSKKK